MLNFRNYRIRSYPPTPTVQCTQLVLNLFVFAAHQSSKNKFSDNPKHREVNKMLKIHLVSNDFEDFLKFVNI